MFTPKDIRNILSYLQNVNDNVKIDISEFNKNLQRHSDYPSLLSIVDVISDFGFKSSAYKLENKDFDSLPSFFLAQIKNNEYKATELVLIEKKDNFILFDGIQLNLDDFLQLSTGVFILVENKNTSTKKYYISCMMFLLIGVFLYFFSNGLFSYYILLSLSVSGLYLSVYFFESLFNIRIASLNNICQKDKISDCKAISNSKKWKIFNYINFSDLSLAFFTTQIICVISLFLNVSTALITEMYLLNGIFIIPIIILSVFYQFFIEKKWCKVCLLIVLNLITQLAFAFYLYSSLGYPDFKYYSFITFGLIYILCFILWTLILKKVLQKNKELTEINESLNSITGDYDIFKAALLSKDRKNVAIYNDKHLLSFGSGIDVLNITIVTDPFCKYCKTTNKIIRSILEKHSQNIKVNFLFNVDFTHKYINFYREIVDSYLKNNEKAFFDFICNENNIKTLDDNINFPHLAKIDEYLVSQNMLCKANKITFFPTVLINGYEYPLNYDSKKLENFINQLISDKNSF
jgi:uncharacterized membrane protein